MNSVMLVDVAPRDGIQSIAPFIPTATKLALIRALMASGIRRIEIGSFVNPGALPQMSDIGDIVAELGPDARSAFAVLVPNRKGAERALEAGVDQLVYVFSVSEAHNRNNVRRPVEESIAELNTLLEDLRPAGRFRLDISTAFHCPFRGEIPLEALVSALSQIAPRWPEIEICLCDTTGRATPNQVKAAFHACREAFGADRDWAYHAHDTYGFGLASVWAAYEAGVRIFDAAAGGLGGCPFAPGASGNIATEDVVYLFETSGISTGIDFTPLLTASRLAASLEGAKAGGNVRELAAGRNRTRADLAKDRLLDGSPRQN